MPTFNAGSAFYRYVKKLEATDRAAYESFRASLKMFIEDLDTGNGFRPRLGVKAVQGKSGWYEMAWAYDGRAIFRYGKEIRPGMAHIEWLHIGNHKELFGR